MKTSILQIALASSLCLLSFNASAQLIKIPNSGEEPMQQPPEEEAQPGKDGYEGVTPGVHDVVDHTRVPKIRTSATHELTWVGYQKLEGKDRVFLQFNNLPYYTSSVSGQKLIIVFDDTAPTAKNFERLIDASAFRSRVQKIQTDYKRSKTTITITFAGANNSAMSQENGYLFIDFPQ